MILVPNFGNQSNKLRFHHVHRTKFIQRPVRDLRGEKRHDEKMFILGKSKCSVTERVKMDMFEITTSIRRCHDLLEHSNRCSTMSAPRVLRQTPRNNQSRLGSGGQLHVRVARLAKSICQEGGHSVCLEDS